MGSASYWLKLASFSQKHYLDMTRHQCGIFALVPLALFHRKPVVAS